MLVEEAGGAAPAEGAVVLEGEVVEDADRWVACLLLPDVGEDPVDCDVGLAAHLLEPAVGAGGALPEDEAPAGVERVDPGEVGVVGPEVGDGPGLPLPEGEGPRSAEG